MPIINSNTINIEELSRYPEGSLGKEYTRFLEKNVRYKCNLPFKVYLAFANPYYYTR